MYKIFTLSILFIGLILSIGAIGIWGTAGVLLICTYYRMIPEYVNKKRINNVHN